MDKTSLGDRMKAYENAYRLYLPRRLPIIIRIDGCHFHNFTRGLEKPYDDDFMYIMQQTAHELAANIMGAKFVYTQSDEISILLTNNDTLVTEAWFNNNLQKLTSVSASMATYYFNKYFNECCNLSLEDVPIRKAEGRIAIFDSRAFILPESEIVNYFIWRQQDCTRNAIQSAGQAYFSHKELHGKSCNEIQEMLFREHGINFDNYPTDFKRGSAARRDESGHWILDTEIPVFTQDRNFIESTFLIE